MDWPVAATLITAISTVGVALIKFVPRRENGHGLNSRETGEVLARLRAVEQEVQHLRQAVGRIEGSLGCKP